MVRFSMQTLPPTAPPSKRMRMAASEEATITTAPVASAPVASASAEPPVGSFLATFDVDTLECTVCMELLAPPIFQCSNGHIACHSCRSKMSVNCPSCSQPMGNIRCLAIEKLIETLQVSCKYAFYGCGHMPKFTQKVAHESTCEFMPCTCPVKPCMFSAPSKEFSAHLMESHRVKTFDFPCEVWYTLWLNATDTHLLLKVEGIPFLLHQDKEALGSMLYLTYFGSLMQDEYSYQIEVKNGKKRLSFESVPQSSSQGLDMDFVLIPSHMYPKEGHLQLQIYFRRIGNSSAKKKITFSDCLF